MKIVQGINYFFGSFLKERKIHLNSSLNFLERRRTIDKNYLDYIRLATLELAAEEINSKGLQGAVAELGVYKGKFARYLNEYFPGRKLFLFDTFEGFDIKDVKSEQQQGFSDGKQDFSNTSIDGVLKLMKTPGNCIIKKGYFPATAEGITEAFVFVSLDTDLYDPIYNGLKFFYPRLVKGGYIFIHDYNNDGYIGAKKAVQDFAKENNVSYVPIADSCGTAIIVK
ncbi:MAG: TylF/MycF/NovP-related O-methyltransferase [Ferruginibacter sp.]